MLFPILVGARWLHFAGLSLLVGTGFYRLLVEPGRGLPTWLVRWTAGLVAFSGIVWLSASIAAMTGSVADALDPQTLHAVFFETDFGRIDGLRLALLALVAGLALAPMPEAARLALLSGAAAILLATQAWIGHAANADDTWRGAATMLAYDAHVVAAACWVGSLPALLTSLRRGGCAEDRVLRRYSTAAVGAVVVAVAGGVINAGVRVGGDAASLTTTAYGRVLTGKVALVAIMLAIAALNRLVLMPSMDGTRSDRSCAALRTAVAIESALALCVLGAASLLGVLAPSH